MSAVEQKNISKFHRKIHFLRIITDKIRRFHTVLSHFITYSAIYELLIRNCGGIIVLARDKPKTVKDSSNIRISHD